MSDVRGDVRGDVPATVGIRAIRAVRKVWSGVEVAAIDYHCEGRVLVDLAGPRHRLGVLLQQVGGFSEGRTRPDKPGINRNPGARYFAFTPAGMPIWGYSDRLSYSYELALTFDSGDLSARLGESLREDIDLARRPWMSSERLFSLSELLAAEVAGGGELGQLYGEGLVLALVVEFLRTVRAGDPAPRKGGLNPRQLREVTAYMRENLAAPIGLRELAGVSGMSQAHFSRAFKASTGVPPHRWQLNARVERAQQLLLRADVALAEVALQLGFADQSHLTRVFRRAVGTTPSAWRRAHGRTTR